MTCLKLHCPLYLRFPLFFQQTVRSIEVKDNSKNIYIGLENINSWTGTLNNNKNITQEGISKTFEKGDILFSKLRPYLAKVFIAEFNGACTSELLIFKTKNNRIFILYLFLSVKFIDLVDRSTYGSKMPRASWDFIGNIIISLPSFEEQKAIVTYLDEQTKKIDDLKAKYRQEIDLINEYKERLIYDVVTGKINVMQE